MENQFLRCGGWYLLFASSDCGLCKAINSLFRFFVEVHAILVTFFEFFGEGLSTLMQDRKVQNLLSRQSKLSRL